jgi:nucleoside-diphosphate-sugar epimerase
VVRCYAARGWLEASVLRLAGAYGPGLFRGGALLGDALQRTVARAAAGDPVTVSPRLAGHEYLHAGDAAGAIRLVLELGRSGVYNVGTGRVHGAAQVAAALRAALPGSSVTAVEPAGPLPPVLDTGALRRAVPRWRCRELAAGLAELVAALRAHPWLAGPGDAGDPAARAEPAVRARAAAAPAGAHAVEAEEG